MTGKEPTTTDPWVDRLSDYLDGELDAGERARLEAHLAGCAECAATLAQLGDVVRRARSLVPREPARDLWPAIAAGIGAPQADVLPLRLERRDPTRRLSFSVPQLVAASLVLAMGSAVAGRFLVRAEPDAPLAAQGAGPSAVLAGSVDTAPPPGYAEELGRLQLALDEGRERLDPNTVRILEKNLAVIDRAIRESQEALAVDPGNPFLKEHLERAYRGKVDYMRQATELLSWGA